MALREGLLVLLSEGPRHGYDLRADFERSTGALWPLNSGQVYSTLERLERDGLVGSSADADDLSGRRRLYSLTAAGEQSRRSWLRSPEQLDRMPRDELVMKVLLAAAVGRREVSAVINTHRRYLMKELGAVQRSRRDDKPEIEAEMVADALIGRLEADLRWLDRCEERLRHHQANGARP